MDHISETKGTSRPSSNLFEAGVQDSHDEHDPAGRTDNASKACQKRQCTNAQSPSALRNRVGLGHHNTFSLLHSVKPEHDSAKKRGGIRGQGEAVYLYYVKEMHACCTHSISSDNLNLLTPSNLAMYSSEYAKTSKKAIEAKAHPRSSQNA